ncbi:hypothetical protein EGW08_017427 [Elysia chlorotica]|uniref:Uncharacterized protein n=1 Tax=Elysia chlorotica TaxID=188477 RepID=A0A3S0ZH80_ELYCH|nr:hypothetical protein EGW08_017427 [Elysia chlorotica]
MSMLQIVWPMVAVWVTLSSVCVEVSVADVPGAEECIEICSKGCMVGHEGCTTLELNTLCKADWDECKGACRFSCNCMVTCDSTCANTFDACKLKGDNPLNVMKCISEYVRCQGGCKTNCGVAGLFFGVQSLNGGED